MLFLIISTNIRPEAPVFRSRRCNVNGIIRASMVKNVRIGKQDGVVGGFLMTLMGDSLVDVKPEGEGGAEAYECAWIPGRLALGGVGHNGWW